MNISRKSALALLALLFVVLLVGTQIPGAWRDEAFRVAHMPWQMNKVAHFCLFAAIGWLAHAAPLRYTVVRVVVGALLAALLTEGLQYFAAHRDPSWTDVAFDMAGAGAGLALAHWGRAKAGH
jgi:VanZ family protein